MGLKVIYFPTFLECGYITEINDLKYFYVRFGFQGTQENVKSSPHRTIPLACATCVRTVQTEHSVDACSQGTVVLFCLCT